MELIQPDRTKEVTEYDFTFNVGMALPVSVDTEAGDTIKEYEDRFVLELVAKPSMADSSLMLQPEKVTVFKNTLATIHERKRKLILLSPEEQFELQKTLHQMTEPSEAFRMMQ